MSATVDHAVGRVRAQACIVATARYIPSARVPAQLAIPLPEGRPLPAREKLMQSVYADTLRWRRDAGVPGSGQSLECLATGMPRYLACESRLLLSDMASIVAREAIQRSPGEQTLRPDQVIVCATAFEHDLALSCAGRLNSELGSRGVPFAIGQLQGVSFFLALQILTYLLSNDEHIESALIAGAERWLAPFSRRAGMLTAFGDGAAAIVVTRALTSGWRVCSVLVSTPSTPVPLMAGNPRVDETTVIETIGETCRRASLQPDAVTWIVPPRINTGLACRVTEKAGLPVDRIWYPTPDDIGYLSAADAPAQLHALLQTLDPANGQSILIWSAGFQGQAACAVLEYHGS